MTYPKT